MYKITLHYQSNKIGVYTTEIVTATEFKKGMRLCRMYDRWLNILCPHLDEQKYTSNLVHLRMPNPYDFGFDRDGLRMRIIQSHLNDLNEMNKEKIESGEECKRTFNITVEEII